MVHTTRRAMERKKKTRKNTREVASQSHDDVTTVVVAPAVEVAAPPVRRNTVNGRVHAVHTRIIDLVDGRRLPRRALGCPHTM